MSKQHGAELQDNRLQILAFLRTEPKVWQTPVGALKASERRQRLDMAKKFAQDHVKDWLIGKGTVLEVLVDTSANDNRQEFCLMLAGDWIPEEKR
ncbi:MAG: hypothetical protein IH969_10815 [Candidatus Krumholzibacteriota bacterium]|nr:hypothetical protein [Candidatus Krumholzibacteriota bacterium]